VIILLSLIFYPLILFKNNIKEKKINEDHTLNQFPNTSYTVNKTPFKVGYINNPLALDPVTTWDTPSYNVQYQIVERLVALNFSTHPNYELIPALAESWIWESNTRISFTIRQNVYFHDGTLLNANAVRWNFERLMWFCNVTGSLPENATSWTCAPSSVFYLTNGTYIFESFEVTGPNTFVINLNAPFSALLDLLCSGPTSILSPSSTPRYRYLNLTTEAIVGTGPFVYDGFEQDANVRFHAYHNYWRGKAQIEEMIWYIITDDTSRVNLGKAGYYDYITGVPGSQIDKFKTDPDFHVEEVGEGLCYYYLEIYCGPFDTGGNWHTGHVGDYQYQKNPPYLRRALAWALNYSYIYEQILGGYATEGTTAVPRSMPGHNASVVQASDDSFTWDENIIKARQILKDNAADIVARGGIDCSGFNVTDESDWLGKNILGRALEVNLHIGSTSNELLNQLMADNFNRTGIQISETIRYWNDYKTTGQNSPYEMDLSYTGWCPDYLSPFNMIDPLFNLASSACFSRINDTSPGGLTDMMNEASGETNRTAQLEIYKDIQSYIFDINRALTPASHVHISGWVFLVNSVHKTGLENVPYNTMNILDFYPIKWIPGDPTIPIYAYNTPFIVGIDNNPRVLDPVDTWDNPSFNVQHQVVEGLVAINYSNHPNYELIPALAESWEWESNKRISFTIRQNVYFHDGTLLDAYAVRWNFERLMWFCNVTGSLPENETSWTCFPSSNFFLTNGTYIFESFEVAGPYTFVINLNVPFGALEDLLCFGVTAILSPSSTPRYRYLNLTTDTLVGTGPFVYDGFEQDANVRFHAYHNYWRGEAQIKEMIWYIITDDNTRMNASLTGYYDYIEGVPTDQIDTFKAIPDFHVEEVGEGLCHYYLEIYCGPYDTDGNWYAGYEGNCQHQRNPPYLRRALAWALNYSYIYEDIHSGYATEGVPAIPRSMQGYNASVVQASDNSFTWDENIIKARQILKDNAADIEARGGMSEVQILGLDPTNESEWLGKNILGRALELNLHNQSSYNQDLNQLIADNFNRTGIQISETTRNLGVYLDTGQNSPWEMDLSYIGWCPDYLNPYNMIDPLFNLASSSCFSRINDTSPGGLTEMINAAAIETNKTAQLEIYKDIQSYIFDVNRTLTPASHAHISVWVLLIYSIHKTGLENVPYNAMRRIDFYPIKWAPGNFNLTSDVGVRDLDGNFNLAWTGSPGADTYSVFTSSSFITELNGSETVLTLRSAISPYSITGLLNGTYYYVIAAHNELGYTLSTCISVTVEIIPPGSFNLNSNAGSPDTDGIFSLTWTSSKGADNYSVYTYNHPITEINISLTILAYQNASSPYAISGLLNGNYYYIAVAYNMSGITLSNILHIKVKIEYYSIDDYTIVPPIMIDSSGKTGYTWSQISVLDWCSGSGTSSDPYIIEWIIINGGNLGSCLEIRNSQVHFEIRNSVFAFSGSRAFDAGIKLYNVTNGLLSKLNCSLNNNIGIILINCLSIMVTESDMNENDVGGIYLLKSHNNFIKDNDKTISRNGNFGIKLNASLYNTISGNYISHNTYGIFIFRSNHTTVSENFLIKNTKAIEEQESESTYKEKNKIIPIDEGPSIEIIIITTSITAAVVVLGITGAYVLKKKMVLKDRKPSWKQTEKIRKKLKEKLANVEHLIKENKLKLAYKNLMKIKDTADQYDFFDIFNEATRKVEICKDIEAGIHKEVVKEEKAVPVSAVTILEKEVEEEKTDIFKLFLSYSTLDSDHFQIPRIVKELENFPEIERVLYWEADSARNIVEYMEETLKGSNIFVLFCSENSSRSSAVKDEWMAAFQLRKKGGIEIIPVYENEDNIPILLMPLLNVKYTKEDFSGFIKNLYEEILRKGS